MKHANFIIISYVLTFGTIIGYSLRMFSRARKLDDFVKDADKPWT